MSDVAHCQLRLALHRNQVKLKTHLKQDIHHLFLLKELQDAGAQGVKVRCLGAEVDGGGIGFESVDHALGEGGREVERHEGRAAQLSATDPNLEMMSHLLALFLVDAGRHNTERRAERGKN